MSRLNGSHGKIVFSALILLAFGQGAAGLISVSDKGRWPSDWPAALEPCREKARTIMVATGIQEDVHEIRLASRDEFERIWPVLCWLKSEGGTLTLLSASTSDKGYAAFGKSDQPTTVRILAYTGGKSSKPGGKKLSCSPPWPESAYLPDGNLPEYVTISEDGQTWVSASDRDASKGFLMRARVDLQIVVDSEIVDLNRLRMPADTPIIDKRELAGIAGKSPTRHPDRYAEDPPAGFVKGVTLPRVHYRTDLPLIAMYVDHQHSRGDTEDPSWRVPQVIFAAWKDGCIIWSDDPLNGGAPYHKGRFEPVALEQLLMRMEQDQAFDDLPLNHHHWGPDSSFTALVVADVAKDRWLNMCSWYELMEHEPTLVVTENGAEVLGERDRNEVIANLPESEKRYRDIWAKFRAGLKSLVPAHKDDAEGGAIDFVYRHVERDLN